MVLCNENNVIKATNLCYDLIIVNNSFNTSKTTGIRQIGL